MNFSRHVYISTKFKFLITPNTTFIKLEKYRQRLEKIDRKQKYEELNQTDINFFYTHFLKCIISLAILQFALGVSY